MPDIDVWPPKPNLPDPLTEHDELIAAELLTPSAKTVDYDLVLPHGIRLIPGFHWLLQITSHLSLVNGPLLNRRLLLIQVLQKEKSLDLWQADTFVQSYYQRHGLATATKAVINALIPLLITMALIFVALFLEGFAFYLSIHRDVVLNRPNHGLAILVLDNEKFLLQTASFVLLGLIYTFWLTRYWIIRQRNRKK
jgi:hypothetical protein